MVSGPACDCKSWSHKIGGVLVQLYRASSEPETTPVVADEEGQTEVQDLNVLLFSVNKTLNEVVSFGL